MLISLQKVPRTVMARKDCLLPARARYALGYLVHGLDDPVDGKPHIPVGRPLSPQHVAELLGVRRRYVLNLLSDPTFKTEFNAALALKRQAATPEALHRITEIVGSDNEGVALRAAQVIIGDDAKPSINVAVQTNVGEIKPGYVIRLPAGLVPPDQDASSLGQTAPAIDSASRAR
jgi:hypothetical protein